MSLWTLLSRPVSLQYRLVDGAMRPHPALDGLYDSLEAALSDAIAWNRQDPSAASAVGVEVSTSHGEWRSVRFPQSLSGA